MTDGGGRSRIARGLAQAYATGAIVLVAGVLMWTLYAAVTYLFFCDEKANADRDRAGHLGTVVTDSFAVARENEVLALCRSYHCLGLRHHPITCHEHLACFCSDTTDEAEMARRIELTAWGPIQCTIINRHPSMSDETPPCPGARCLGHLDPPRD